MGQRKDYGKLAEGLMAWTRGDGSEDAEAAAEIVAEAILIFFKVHTGD